MNIQIIYTLYNPPPVINTLSAFKKCIDAPTIDSIVYQNSIQ